MRKDKWSNNEKRLCQKQELLTKQHVQTCVICKKSFDEYEKFGISNTPPCKYFMNLLSNHVGNCEICNSAKIKYREDGIPITTEMREITAKLSEGKLPDISMMKRAASFLFKELHMKSDEIKTVSENADKLVRDSLEKEKD